MPTHDVGLAAADDEQTTAAAAAAAGLCVFNTPWSLLTRRKFIVDSKIYAKEKIALLGE
jgi:hypothetical protein